MKWFNTLSHNRWLEQETDRIFDFGKNSVVPTGFGWLGNKGQIKEEMGTHLWITARMLHVYSVAAAMGRPGAYSLVDHGIKAMNGALRDKKYGGWYACVNDEGVVDASKQGYQHFFALLGAASAVTTGHPEARKLLDYTIEIIEKYFWSEEDECGNYLLGVVSRCDNDYGGIFELDYYRYCDRWFLGVCLVYFRWYLVCEVGESFH